MQKSVAFVVCNNGFGHIKRATLVAQALISEGVTNISILSGKQQAEFFKNGFASSQRSISIEIETGPFSETPSPNQNYLASNNWYDRAGEWLSSRTGVIVSDNYVVPLESRKCLLMGSFLWAEIFAKSDDLEARQQAREERRVLESAYPEMICLNSMAMPMVREKTKPYYTDWFGEHFSGRTSGFQDRLGILFTAGAGIARRDILVRSIISLLSIADCPIYVDKRLMEAADTGIRKHLQLFDFNPESFCKLRLAIGRPGIGLITDCISAGLPLVAIHESGEPEMEYNASRLDELNLGLALQSRLFRPESLLSLYHDASQWEHLHQMILRERMGGHFQAAQKILQYDTAN